MTSHPPTGDTTRVAVYYTPQPDTLLSETAARWLGRYTVSSRRILSDEVQGLSQERKHLLTSAPFHYGFHATLKAPFRVKPGIGLDEVYEMVDACAQQLMVVELPKLEVTKLNDFFCLRPYTAGPSLNLLAEQVVRILDKLRAPLTLEDLARRRKSRLTPYQDELLQWWGYPYVFDEFRFHFSLTGKVTERSEADILQSFLEKRFKPALEGPLLLDGLSVFIEVDGRPFVELERFPLRRQ